MDIDNNKVSFTWNLHWDCNYRCPYCWWHGKWDNVKKHNTYPGIDTLISVWKRIYDMYGEVTIHIADAEPSTYPDFSKLVIELLNYHIIKINSNLSGDFEDILNSTSPNITPERLNITATFHPMFTKIEDFLEKVIIIRRKGKNINMSVTYLAYPPQVKDIPKYKEIFDKNNIPFSVLTFWGEYDSKVYPDSYTDEEIAIIDPSIAKRGGEKLQTKPFNPKDKLCNAGHTYGLIHPDGNVLRCGGGSYKGESIIIDNIFNPDFKLLPSAQPCPSEICPCNEWAVLLQDKP